MKSPYFQALLISAIAVFAIQSIVKAENPESNRLNNEGADLKAAGKFDEAIPILKKAIAADVQNADPYLNLGNIYYFNKKDNLLAKFYYQKAVELEPNNAKSWNHLGLCLRRLKDSKGALTAFKHSVEVEPECSTLCNLADVYIDLNQFQDAQSLLIRASRLPSPKKPSQEQILQGLEYVKSQLSKPKPGEK